MQTITHKFHEKGWNINQEKMWVNRNWNQKIHADPKFIIILAIL